ncbi:hypothetical protein HBI59_192690 [Parastagonospora nodorum]|nr:hypothetical protein HBI59_192690 [Parastagonospora nodorum]
MQHTDNATPRQRVWGRFLVPLGLNYLHVYWNFAHHVGKDARPRENAMFVLTERVHLRICRVKILWPNAPFNTATLNLCECQCTNKMHLLW